MICKYCGHETDNSVYCSCCGKEISSAVETSLSYMQNTQSKPKQKRIWLYIGGGVALALLFCSIFFYPEKVKLPYAWGTPMSQISQNEIVIDKDWNYIVCEDPYQEVDKVKGLDHSYTKYKFNEWGNLQSIEYEFNYNTTSTEERREAMEKTYGKKYYTIQHKKSDYYSTYVWWIDDTVIYSTWCSVRYYDADYYVNTLPLHKDYCDDLLDFFGKK